MLDFDVAIVGAGPGGSATAALLAQRGYSVLLLDRETFPRPKPCAEYLSPEACRVLDALLSPGALSDAKPARLAGMRVVSPAGTSFEGRFPAAGQTGADARHGLGLPRSKLDALIAEAAVSAGAHLWERAPLESIDATIGRRRRLRVRQKSGTTTVTTRLIVGADGLHSRVARTFGLARHGRLTRIALVAHALGVTEMQPLGEMHVGRDAYVGLAPVGGDLTNVSVVVDTNRFVRRGPPAAWFRTTIDTFPELEARFANAESVSGIRGAGPFARSTVRATAHRTVLVGDAADFYDPFTGEGIYAAIHGAELIASCVAPLLERDRLTARDLSAYDRARAATFRSKWIVERAIGWVVGHERALDHVAKQLQAKPTIADTLVGVTGDIVPHRQLLQPAFARQLLW